MCGLWDFTSQAHLGRVEGHEGGVQHLAGGHERVGDAHAQQAGKEAHAKQLRAWGKDEREETYEARSAGEQRWAATETAQVEVCPQAAAHA